MSQNSAKNTSYLFFAHSSVGQKLGLERCPPSALSPGVGLGDSWFSQCFTTKMKQVVCPISKKTSMDIAQTKVWRGPHGEWRSSHKNWRGLQWKWRCSHRKWKGFKYSAQTSAILARACVMFADVQLPPGHWQREPPELHRPNGWVFRRCTTSQGKGFLVVRGAGKNWPLWKSIRDG